MADDLAAKAQRLEAQFKARENGYPDRVEATALIKEPEPDREWVIEDLLECQGRIMLAGAEGSGKSLLGLTLAVQAAAGLPAWDSYKVSLPRKVVYADLEMARSSTRRRLRQLVISAKQFGEFYDNALYLLMRPDGLDLGQRQERRAIQEWLTKIQPELVIIDPLYKMSLTDSVYERDIKPTLKFLDEIRHHLGTALVLIHHLRKRPQGESVRGRDASDIFGSSVLLRWAETTFILNEQNIRIHKDRDGTFGDIKSIPIVRGGQWPIGVGPPSLLPLDEVYDYVSSFGPCSANQLAKELGGRRSDRYDALKSLRDQGRVVEQRGQWEVT